MREAVFTVDVRSPVSFSGLRLGASTVVCTDNLNTGVAVMKSVQDGVRTYETGSLDRPKDRRILVQ